MRQKAVWVEPRGRPVAGRFLSEFLEKRLQWPFWLQARQASTETDLDLCSRSNRTAGCGAPISMTIGLQIRVACAVDPKENLLFLNSGADRVLAISPQGQIVQLSWKNLGSSPTLRIEY